MKGRIEKIFTLIELMVVAAIIAILMALLFPALKSAREIGKRAACMGNARQISFAMSNYSGDYNGWLVPSNAVPEGKLIGNFLFYSNLLVAGAYLPAPKKWKDQYWGNVVTGVWRCPSVGDESVYYMGGLGINLMQVDCGHLQGWGESVNLNSIRRPSSLWFIGDASGNVISGKSNMTVPHMHCPRCRDWTLANARVAAPRHFSSSNVSFIDGHCASVKRVSLEANEGDIFGHNSL